MLWTTDDDMPFDHKPMADDIAPAKTPPKELVLSTLMNQKSTPQWQSRSPASDGQQVHSLVANQVPSLGATISLYGQQDYNK
jgi:hypothetical protein